MKKSLLARHNANKQILLTLQAKEEKISPIPIFDSSYKRLVELVKTTDTLAVRVESIPDKTAGNKNVARAELVAIALKVGNVLKVYAFVSKNDNLSNFIVSSEYILASRMPQRELLDYAKGLTKHIATYATKLTDYGLTNDMVTELINEVADYEIALNEPRQLISERKTGNEQIEDAIDEAYSLLINNIDPLMELFVDDKDFYLSYKSARMIVDPATRSKDTAAETTK